eukprot:1243052-Amorphochlora_amoeboformis.AAC.1
MEPATDLQVFDTLGKLVRRFYRGGELADSCKRPVMASEICVLVPFNRVRKHRALLSPTRRWTSGENSLPTAFDIPWIN